jgi:hypothetical protein
MMDGWMLVLPDVGRWMLPDADAEPVAMNDSSLCEVWHDVEFWMWDVNAKNAAMMLWFLQ